MGRPRNVEHEHHAVHLITAPVNEATAHLAEDEHRASAHAPLPAMWGDRCTMPGWSRSLPPKRKRETRDVQQVAREGSEEVRRKQSPRVVSPRPLKRATSWWQRDCACAESARRRRSVALERSGCTCSELQVVRQLSTAAPVLEGNSPSAPTPCKGRGRLSEDGTRRSPGARTRTRCRRGARA